MTHTHSKGRQGEQHAQTWTDKHIHRQTIRQASHDAVTAICLSLQTFLHTEKEGINPQYTTVTHRTSPRLFRWLCLSLFVQVDISHIQQCDSLCSSECKAVFLSDIFRMVIPYCAVAYFLVRWAFGFFLGGVADWSQWTDVFRRRALSQFTGWKWNSAKQ